MNKVKLKTNVRRFHIISGRILCQRKSNCKNAKEQMLKKVPKKYNYIASKNPDN